MALLPAKGWLNPSYELASTNASLQRLQNLYCEVIESGDEKVIGFLKGCPGLATALMTLPADGHATVINGVNVSSKLRGLFGGGAPLSNADQLFAVCGSKLYEVNAAGSIVGGTNRGDVGNDGYPVQMFGSGIQLFVVSAGQAYIDNGGAATGSNATVLDFLANQGTVSTNVLAVTWETGSQFTPGMVGQAITIAGTGYTVATVPDATDLTLTGTAGVQSSVPYTSKQIEGTCNIVAVGIGSPANVTWLSGPLFTQQMTGNGIRIDGAPYTVAAVQDPTHLTTTMGLVTSYGVVWSTAGASVLARTGAILDSFFVAALDNSKQLNVSLVGDGNSWDPADFKTKESYPDNIGSILADHQELLVLGESHGEVWGPAADPSQFPFDRIDGYSINLGIGAPWSLQGMKDGPIWIAASQRGKPIAYFAKGFVPERISTHAIEQVWAGYAALYTSASVPLLFDAETFVFEMDGHEFWQVSFPIADATWLYDRTASLQMGKAMWSERNSYDGSAFHRHRASCHAYAFGKHWVGDFANGKIYEMSASIYQDAGQTITCIRVLPHICAERLRQFFQRLQLDLETGGGVALTIVLEWSDDGGTTFVGGGSDWTITTSTSKKMDRVSWTQLGSADDRVWRITVTGNARKALLALYDDVLVGIS